MIGRMGVILMAGGTVAIGGAALLALATVQGGGGAATSSQRPAKPSVVQPTVIGMNLGQSSYYGPEWIFANLVQNNGWLTTPETNKLTNVKVDEGGHPIDVPKDTEVSLTLQMSSVWKSGDYRCNFTPGWSVRPRFRGTVSGDSENFKLNIPKAEKGWLVSLILHAKQDGARLDKASCIPVGLAPDTEFTPEFLADMKPFKVIRFMDWMQTNNAPLRTWAARPKATDFNQWQRGMSVEDMVDVANTLGADPWFTLPLDTDADYYRNFAAYVRDHLKPGLKAYVELSNEVWNPGFQQNKDATQRGKALYPNVEDYQAADYYYADRIIDLMKIWEDVFAGQTSRIVRVVGGQVGWKERSDGLLAHKDLWKHADAYAVAPYFGGAIQDIAESGPARVDKGLARLPAMATKVVTDMVAQKAVVEKYGIRFISYEGGPDVIGFTPDAAADAQTMIHDPRMYDIYTNFLEDYRKRIGGLLVLYNGTSGTTYGHKDYTGQPISETPKMRAVVDFINRHPQ